MKPNVTPPADEALAVVAEEDNRDVVAPHEDTALTTTPQVLPPTSMPSPTRDTADVPDEGDAVDADNEEVAEEVLEGAEEEELGGGGPEEVLGRGSPEEVLGGAGPEEGKECAPNGERAGETPAPEKDTAVAVHNSASAATDERETGSDSTKDTPKVVDPEKPEQVNAAITRQRDMGDNKLYRRCV